MLRARGGRPDRVARVAAIVKRRLEIPRVVLFEAVGAAVVIALIAMNEYVDLPKLLFGEEPTPLRHHEFIMELCAVSAVTALVMALSWSASWRHRRLASLLVMCSWCRQVRVGDRWIPVEAFLKERDATTSTLGLCPSCYAEQSTRQGLKA